MPSADDPATFSAPIDEQLPIFIDEHREVLSHILDDLTEAEARAELVPSKTTLLGLMKHATFVEKVWFAEAVTGRSRDELGIVAGPDESFDLSSEDTVESVQRDYRTAIEESRAAVAGLGLDDLLPGNRRGPLPLRWIYLHVLRELAQHCGHADILREQILARRS